MKRLFGILIDTMIVLAIAAGIIALKYDYDQIMTGSYILIVLCTVTAVYGIVFELTARATIGKLLTKNVVVTESGKRLNLIFIIVRNMIKILIPSFICFLCIISNETIISLKIVDGKIKCINGSDTLSGATTFGLLFPIIVVLLIIIPFVATKRHRFFHDIFSGSYVMNREEAVVLGSTSTKKSPTVETPTMETQANTAVTYLVCTDGQFKGRKWPLSNGLILGKSYSVCDIVFDEFIMNVADLHCKVFEKEGELWVRDLKSSYGINLEGGARIPSDCESTVHLGQKFTLGFSQTFMLVKE